MSNNNRPLDQLIENFLTRVESLGTGVIVMYGLLYVVGLIALWFTIASIGEHRAWNAVASLIVFIIVFYTPTMLLSIFKPKSHSQNGTGQDGNTNQQQRSQPRTGQRTTEWYEEPLTKFAGSLTTMIAIIMVFYLFLGGTTELRKKGGLAPIVESAVTGKDPEVLKLQKQLSNIEKEAQKKAEAENKRAYNLLKIQETEATKRLKITEEHETRRLKIESQNSGRNYVNSNDQKQIIYTDPSTPIIPAGHRIDIGNPPTAKDFGRNY